MYYNIKYQPEPYSILIAVDWVEDQNNYLY